MTPFERFDRALASVVSHSLRNAHLDDTVNGYYRGIVHGIFEACSLDLGLSDYQKLVGRYQAINNAMNCKNAKMSDLVRFVASYVNPSLLPEAVAKDENGR